MAQALHLCSIYICIYVYIYLSNADSAISCFPLTFHKLDFYYLNFAAITYLAFGVCMHVNVCVWCVLVVAAAHTETLSIFVLNDINNIPIPFTVCSSNAERTALSPGTAATPGRTMTERHFPFNSEQPFFRPLNCMIT